jgi:hypothetical protein
VRGNNGHRALIFLLLLALTGATILLGWQLHRNALRDKKLKTDYFTVNQIKYGLLSGNNWTYQVNRIIATKIDSFHFESQNRAVMQAQITDLLGRLFDEAEKVLHKKREGLKDKIKYSIINSFVDLDDYRPDIPTFSKAIVDELEKSKHRDKLKAMIKDKVSGILDAQNQDTTGEKAQVLRKYGYKSAGLFNEYIRTSTETIRQAQRTRGYLIIVIMVTVLLLWLYIFRIKKFFALTFLFSVLMSFIALFIGVSLPMIEIDARISELNLSLLSGHIVFYEQVIFYQAKSILDVIRILITHGRGDTVFVGFLILLFSVLFPVTKLICASIYLFVKERSNRFIRFMAFNSGKWSMADVMVIAIFMAYVGFQSILDNQLEDITTHSETINVVTTNRTNLQTGFLVFVAFTLFTLILADILKRITRLKERMDKRGQG